MSDIIFLKLGGSPMTDETKRCTPWLNSLAPLADQIQSALSANLGPDLLIGHGSGPFGH